jgi:hypothetical protein
MIGAIFTLRTFVGLFTSLVGLFVLMAAATIPTSLLAQQNSATRSVSAPLPAESASGKAASSREKRADSPRRKRGGPASSPGNDIGATPAEGQSDLIKVLQPGSRQK